MFGERLARLRWRIGRDSDQVDTEPLKCWIDVMQLDQLLVAVWSPAPAVENDYRRFGIEPGSEIDVIS